MYGRLNDEVFSEGLTNALSGLEEMKARGLDDPDEPNALPIRTIEQVPHVFQIRGTDLVEHHVVELQSLLKRGTELKPILVWRCGQHALLLDGHHRVEAYKRHELEQRSLAMVPVSWFKGTAEEAMKAAAAANVEVKLPMTQEQRLNLGWRLVLTGRFSKKAIADTAGIGTNTVANMRRVMGDLGADAASAKTWRKALMTAQSGGREINPDDIEEWVELQAQAYADRMAKAFHNKLTTNPTIAGKTLSIHFGRASTETIKEWVAYSDIDEDTFIQMFKELFRVPF